MSADVGKREAHKIATRGAIQSAADALFVVPCTATGVDELTVGNAEYGAVALAAKALWIA